MTNKRNPYLTLSSIIVWALIIKQEKLEVLSEFLVYLIYHITYRYILQDLRML